MDRLSHLVPRVLAKRGLQDQAGASYAVYMATNWIAEKLPPCKDLSNVRSLSDTVLEIHADHPIILQELRQQSESLKQHLNSLAGVTVTEIRISRSMGSTN